MIFRLLGAAILFAIPITVGVAYVFCRLIKRVARLLHDIEEGR